MANDVKTKGRWRFALLILIGVLAVTCVLRFAIPPMPARNVFLVEVARLSDLHRDNLVVVGGGYHSGLFRHTAHMDFRVAADPDRLVHVQLTRPFYLLPWRLTEFTDPS